MSRDIRFRAWDTKRSEWLGEIPPKEYMLDADEWDHHDCDDAFMRYPDNPLPTFKGRISLEEYTGLKDAKGREIFENDIVNFINRGVTHGPEPEVVKNALVWFDVEDGCWTFGKWTTARDEGGDSFTYGYTLAADRIDMASVEIVGNVHQHPELLKS